ncbi:MAG: Clp protease N-terminal domain-containing protein [Pseudonocardiaceae bacterium]
MLWDRLSPEGRAVMRLAYVEARELGHPCIADEHVLLAILRHGANQAAALLRTQGLDLATARTELQRVGPTLGPRTDPAGSLRSLGIDADDVRRRLEAIFGADALQTAEGRVRRRPRWRGGHPRPNALCVHLLAKRSLEFAARLAEGRGEAAITPDHLLYGILRDARDPLGTQLSRRSRKELAALGWRGDRPNPLRMLHEARGIDLARLTAELAGNA